MDASRNRQLALAIGTLWLALGVLGIALASDGLLFGVLTVGLGQNVIHLVVGAMLAAAALVGVQSARATNLAVGIAALALGMIGLFTSGTGSNLLALNGAGNVAHFGTATVLLIASLGTDRARRE